MAVPDGNLDEKKTAGALHIQVQNASLTIMIDLQDDRGSMLDNGTKIKGATRHKKHASATFTELWLEPFSWSLLVH